VAIVAQTPFVSSASPQPPAPGATPQSTRSPFPDGPGRDALFKVCNDCHGPESVLAHLKTRDEWNKTLDEMAANGAQGSDREWTDILDYLAKHFSPIAVNKATATELAATLDVPAAVAEAIVRARTDKGRLASIDDLKQAAGGDAALKSRPEKIGCCSSHENTKTR